VAAGASGCARRPSPPNASREPAAATWEAPLRECALCDDRRRARGKSTEPPPECAHSIPLITAQHRQAQSRLRALQGGRAPPSRALHTRHKQRRQATARPCHQHSRRSIVSPGGRAKRTSTAQSHLHQRQPSSPTAAIFVHGRQRLMPACCCSPTPARAARRCTARG
jgi:hypothetical protein